MCLRAIGVLMKGTTDGLFIPSHVRDRSFITGRRGGGAQHWKITGLKLSESPSKQGKTFLPPSPPPTFCAILKYG